MTDRADEIVPPVGIAQRLAAELEELLKWRSSVASALGRPSGVFYVDVPARIKKLAARVQELEAQNEGLRLEVAEYLGAFTENTRLREALEKHLHASPILHDPQYSYEHDCPMCAALKEMP